jgi:hypothetical protein
MTSDNTQYALDFPEDFLWIRHADNSQTVIHRDRLEELFYGGAVPETPAEKLLVENREWLRILVQHALGERPIHIDEAGPLPAWNEAWLDGAEPDPELEAEAARKIEWSYKPSAGPAVGPSWLINSGQTRMAEPGDPIPRRRLPHD